MKADIKDIIKRWEEFFQIREPEDYIALYTHIPFCVNNCKYCFLMNSSNVLRKQEEIDQYLVALDKKMSLFKSLFKGEKISALYIGGGSPSILTLDQMKKLFDIIQCNFELDFKSDNSNMFAMEVNPKDLDIPKMNLIADSFINRISAGVQSFNKTVQKAENRLNNSSENICYKIGYLMGAMKSKHSRFNVDLMLALEEETLEMVIKDFQILSDLEIPRITVYAKRTKRSDSENKKFKEYIIYCVSEIIKIFGGKYSCESTVGKFKLNNIFVNRNYNHTFNKIYNSVPEIYNNTLAFGNNAYSWIIPSGLSYKEDSVFNNYYEDYGVALMDKARDRRKLSIDDIKKLAKNISKKIF